MTQFFKRLSYSLGNEDWLSEKAALRIQPADRVLCVTASGDRPLNLLTEECKEIVSIDLNPIQNHLLSLKIAALKHLDYDAYMGFLGAVHDKNRRDTLKHLSPHLPSTSAAYWNQNPRMIQSGVLYQGVFEKIAKKVAQGLNICRKKKISKLFNFDELEHQKAFVENHWDTFPWRSAFKIALHPAISKRLIGDPGLYEHIGQNTNPGMYIYQLIHSTLCRQIAKKNPLLTLVFLGRIGEEAMPPYLTQEGTWAIRPRLDKVSISTANIVDFLERQPDDSFDCFSISDVASYLSPGEYLRLLKGIHRTGKPGARFCLRQLLTAYTIPQQWKGLLCREPELEKRLDKEDRSIFYRFMVGKIKK